MKGRPLLRKRLIRQLRETTWAATTALMLSAPSAFADDAATEVARWVDGNGTVHFGNPQFAPARADLEVESIKIKPANGMDVPQNTTYREASSRGPNVAVLDRVVKKNPRGFRGYHRRNYR